MQYSVKFIQYVRIYTAQPSPQLLMSSINLHSQGNMLQVKVSVTNWYCIKTADWITLSVPYRLLPYCLQAVLLPIVCCLTGEFWRLWYCTTWLDTSNIPCLHEQLAAIITDGLFFKDMHSSFNSNKNSPGFIDVRVDLFVVTLFTCKMLC